MRYEVYCQLLNSFLPAVENEFNSWQIQIRQLAVTLLTEAFLHRLKEKATQS